jgi:hypothetical protein
MMVMMVVMMMMMLMMMMMMMVTMIQMDSFKCKQFYMHSFFLRRFACKLSLLRRCIALCCTTLFPHGLGWVAAVLAAWPASPPL